MKKRIVSTMAILALMFGTYTIPNATAQVFLDNEEMEKSFRGESDEEEGEAIEEPTAGITIDQYAMLGEGLVVLGCLGGVYLLGKRKKEQE